MHGNIKKKFQTKPKYTQKIITTITKKKKKKKRLRDIDNKCLVESVQNIARLEYTPEFTS